MQTLILPATLDALSQISQFISNAAEQTGLDDRAAWQVQLAVDEAATNIIQHAYDSAAPGDISLKWHCQDTSFVVMLRDHGRGFDPQDVPEPDLLAPLEDRQVGGLGIYLMTHLMDEVHFDFNPHTGNLVTMVKYITSNPPDDVVVLPVPERLDALTVTQFSKEAQQRIEQGARYLLLDLSRLAFLNSSGLRALLLIRKELMTLRGELRLAALQPQVREIFDLTGFAQVFAIHTTCEEARKAFGEGRT
jgi:serine/threonine-protein kinase RsbW